MGRARIAIKNPRRKEVEIFTDGSCSDNPGLGGWAAILRVAGHDHALSGRDPATTNNRMELMAVIIPLEALEQPSRVTIHSDSQYVIDGATKWIIKWQMSGWRTTRRQAVKNIDLWRRLDAALGKHGVKWIAVKGFEHPESERADQMAREEIEKLR
jgi:ribonuclease HI